MKEVKHACRFCGQFALVEVPDSFTDEEIGEEVALQCKCKPAKEYQEKKEKEEQLEMAKTSAKGTTFELFHESHPDVEELLNAAINPVADGKIKSVTIKTGGKTTATIKKSKDTIVVQREDKSTYTRETELS